MSKHRERRARRTFLALAIVRARKNKERWEQLMAQFEDLNTAIDGLSESIDSLASRLEGATVEDPAVQAQVDAAAARIRELQSTVDGIAADGGTETGEPPVVDNTLPNPDDQPHVEHRKGK
jgi:outer membrane murein-binding lipoprotein Lpp